MESKDLTIQSYEKKIANTLREEKYEIPSFQKYSKFIESISAPDDDIKSIAYKHYKKKIYTLRDSYITEFDEILLPIISEKGLNFEFPEGTLGPCIYKYDTEVGRIIDLLLLIGRITNEPYYDSNLLSTSWGISLDGINNIPFMLALGCSKMIVLDEHFNMDLHFFAALGGMPDIRPLSKVGNIELPPNTFNINLQVLLGTQFKQIAIILLKQSLDAVENFAHLFTNIGLVVDTKSAVHRDFSGIKWIKNSSEYSLFKQKSFLHFCKAMKLNGLIVDKSVSPMQTQKIQSLSNRTIDLNVGFEVNKIGTIQYSVIQKKEDIPITYDSFNEVIVKTKN